MTHLLVIFFFFNDTATTEIYTLSLHDALPICGDEYFREQEGQEARSARARWMAGRIAGYRPESILEVGCGYGKQRSEEHTSELQSRQYLVCRLLLEKKKNKTCIYQ